MAFSMLHKGYQASGRRTFERLIGEIQDIYIVQNSLNVVDNFDQINHYDEYLFLMTLCPLCVFCVHLGVRRAGNFQCLFVTFDLFVRDRLLCLRSIYLNSWPVPTDFGTSRQKLDLE